MMGQKGHPRRPTPTIDPWARVRMSDVGAACCYVFSPADYWSLLVKILLVFIYAIEGVGGDIPIWDNTFKHNKGLLQPYGSVMHERGRKRPGREYQKVITPEMRGGVSRWCRCLE
jgi:hypothetical protein